MRIPIHISATLLGLATISSSFAATCCETDTRADHTAPTLAKHTDTSLFNIESLWENEEGEKFHFSQIGGRLQLVAMVYTTCAYACPRIIADMKSIQKHLTNMSSNDLGYCLITIDPERDTIDVYKKYADKHKLTENQWTFLRGESGDVLELANLIGVKYVKTPDGEYSHSNILTLLNPKGEIIHQQIGLGADSTETIEIVKTLLANKE